MYGNRILKCVYKMAGHSALTGENGLRRYYERLRSEGKTDEHAAHSVCRKIAAISLSVWKQDRSYDDRLVDNPLE